MVTSTHTMHLGRSIPDGQICSVAATSDKQEAWDRLIHPNTDIGLMQPSRSMIAVVNADTSDSPPQSIFMRFALKLVN